MNYICAATLPICNIGVRDGGHAPPPKKKEIGKIFFGQLLCKIRAFSGKNRVKFGNLVNFSGKYGKKIGYFDNFSGRNHVKFGHFVNFYTYFSGKNVVPP